VSGPAAIEQRGAGLELLLQAAREKGIKDERARIMRCRNVCFGQRGAGTSAASMKSALMHFDGMVVRGDDPKPAT